jgi:alkylation response protein AidB-like acyl-CoA dehydrogenase
MATTGSERGLSTRSPARDLTFSDRLFELYHACGSPPHLRDRILTAWTKAEAYRVQTLQVITDTVEGRPPGAETSLVKLWWSELDIELQHLAQELLGPEAEVEGPWAKSWIFSLAGTIYAGTNEVQRNIAAERVLGLPRK